MEKDQINAKCPECGAELFIAGDEKEIVCPHCSATINSVKAKKYFQSLSDNSGVKEAHGEDYLKVMNIISAAYDLIAEKEFKAAEEKAKEALAYTDSDYRVYLAIVAAKTENYTDLKDESHKIYLNKAISFADQDAKKEIADIYKPYYMKRNLTEEELKNYSAETTQKKKKKLESSLKNMIPEFMAKGKRNKVFLILFPIVFALGVGVFVLSVLTEYYYLSLLAVALVAGGYALFRFWYTGTDGCKAFNSLLDLYDVIDSVTLTDEEYSEIYSRMQDLSDRFADRDPVLSMAPTAKETVSYLSSLKVSEIDEFIAKNKYYSQFVEE